MKVLTAKSAGFCWGVQRAVRKARELASRQDTGTLFTDGSLIHNAELMHQLESEGICRWDGHSPLDSGTLIIRAHGIPPSRREALGRLSVRLEDATCPDVARIQALIRRHARKGYHIVIFGDPGHAEVVGLEGYAEGNGHVVASAADVEKLPAMSPVCLVAQSTQLPDTYQTIIQAIQQRFPDAVILDTICNSTRNRQSELIELARQVDAIVVVGDAHSANTVRLAELARTLRPTHHIQTADQLKPEWFSGCRTAGLTAGASTPDFVIAAVRTRLESMP